MKQNLDYVFNPRSIAVAGVSTKQTNLLTPGQRYLKYALDFGFKGKIYPVNPTGGEILGLKIYPDIKETPGPVDYVISCIPASAAPQLVKDCDTKGVKVIHFYTSGFSETGNEEGKRLEEEVSSLAHQSGIRIIGPNSGGIYCPQAGLSFFPDFAKESGPVALICQSGGNSVYLVQEGAKRGLSFSKMISYGNAADIDESDVLEYLATDPDTGIILAYIEGVKDGGRFSQVLKQAAEIKPVILIKGGITEPGARAAASHTSALAGSGKIWDGLLHQVGAIKVDTFEELIDMAVTFSYLPPLSGRRVGILGLGGGIAVLATDDCASAGLMVPRFPEEVRKKVRNLLKTEAGTILSNPIDLAANAREAGYYNTLNVLANYGGIDLIMVHFGLGTTFPGLLFAHSQIWDSLMEDAIEAHRKLDKPLIIVIHIPTSHKDYEWMFEAQEKCYGAGIAVYHSISGAAKAVVRFLKYQERKRTFGQG